MPDLGALARTWFEQMRTCGDDVPELIHDGCSVACVGDAPFGYVAVFGAHVDVGLFLGAELADPAGLVQGRGRRMRHVKVRPDADVNCGDVNCAGLSDLIQAGYADIKSRLDVE